MLPELKRVKCKDLKDMVYRVELTYDEIVDILDVKYFARSVNGNKLPIGIFGIININLILISLFPDEVKVNVIIDDIRLRSNLTTNETIKFARKVFSPYKTRFYSIPYKTTR